MKVCKTCSKEKPYDQSAKLNSKASGFMGNRCWECYLVSTHKAYVPKVVPVKPNKKKMPLSAEKYLLYIVDRRHVEIQATPRWVNLLELRAFYESAINLTIATGIRHSVDHIIPLRHELVCGLNVPWNLSVKTHARNSSKQNKFDPNDLETA
jgi:hypothetical protein